MVPHSWVAFAEHLARLLVCQGARNAGGTLPYMTPPPDDSESHIIMTCCEKIQKRGIKYSRYFLSPGNCLGLVAPNYEHFSAVGGHQRQPSSLQCMSWIKRRPCRSTMVMSLTSSFARTLYPVAPSHVHQCQ